MHALYVSRQYSWGVTRKLKQQSLHLGATPPAVTTTQCPTVEISPTTTVRGKEVTTSSTYTLDVKGEEITSS